jgi:para-nitrobenzyl esterase
MPVVETTTGPVAGISENEVHVFRGLRYGIADRFRLAVAPAWQPQVQDASSFGPACFPTLTDADRSYFPRSRLWREYAGYDVMAELSEDCLRLNVWAPAPDGCARPVLFWLHGGGFSWGSGASRWTEGDRLAARKDLIVVTVNHRLGVLGYLDLERRGGSSFEGSGVAGLLDLRLALEWVRDNIAAFGGDPDRVTIAGHSGGGAKVAALLALPSARGLFSRAVIQSGVVSLRSVDRDEAAETTAQLIDAAGGIETLRTIDPERLTRIAEPFRFRPVARTAHLPKHPFDPAAAPSVAGVPLLIGTTLDDAATFKFDSNPDYASISEDELRSWIAEHPATSFGAQADEAIEHYRARSPSASPSELLVAAATARLRLRTHELIARKRAADAAPVYLYLFDYAAPLVGEPLRTPTALSWHGLELPFVFDVADRIEFAGDDPRCSKLAAQMSDAWARFVRDGDPGWPAWDPQSAATMVFGLDSGIRRDPFDDERLLFNPHKETTWLTSESS